MTATAPHQKSLGMRWLPSARQVGMVSFGFKPILRFLLPALLAMFAPARITRQFQITAPHQKSYGFEPMHGPCWSSVVLRLRKSWIWLSEMASLSAVDLPVGSEVKGQCGSRSGCFTNSKGIHVQHRSTSFNIIIEAYSTHNLLLSLVDIEFLKPFEAFTSTSHLAVSICNM